uniref:Uncharacterized protein n=1 Tax=Acrobeloides nanus TaxID=290746 RepID=A0A914CSA1_9BILA
MTSARRASYSQTLDELLGLSTNSSKKLANSETILERPSTKHGRSSSSSTPLSESKNMNSQANINTTIDVWTREESLDDRKEPSTTKNNSENVLDDEKHNHNPSIKEESLSSSSSVSTNSLPEKMEKPLNVSKNLPDTRLATRNVNSAKIYSSKRQSIEINKKSIERPYSSILKSNTSQANSNFD